MRVDTREQQIRLPFGQDGVPTPPFASKAKLDLIDTGFLIQETSARDAETIGYAPTFMAFTSLPHSELPCPRKVINGEVQPVTFSRRNGERSLYLVNHGDIGLPYGKLPRLVIAWVSTEAKRTASRHIDLGSSFSDFAGKLGLSKSGGKRGELTRLRDQATRVLTFQISIFDKRRDATPFKNMCVSDGGVLPWSLYDEGDGNERLQWNGMLHLSEAFFAQCMQHAFPIDVRVLSKLRSPMAIDIYFWLTHRMYSLRRRTEVPWENLQCQYGAAYGQKSKGIAVGERAEDPTRGIRNFKGSFLKELKDVKALWPGLRVESTPASLILLPSGPHIPRS